jgi:hypothetical protein
MGKPKKVGMPLQLKKIDNDIIENIGQLKRTHSDGIKTTRFNDDNNYAGMDAKSSIFRDIMMGYNGSTLWDLGIGWFLCVCLQNIPFLRKSLLTKNVNIYSFLHGSNGQGNNVQLFERKRKMIVAVLLGGSAYRNITNFISSGLKGNYYAELYAPRSHDFDISFKVNNYFKDIDEITHVVIQNLIIFLNMMYNELEEKADKFWSKRRSSDGKPIFVEFNDSDINSKEKLKWTHNSGKIQITLLKNKKYTNIRTNVVIEYTNNKGKRTRESDHIIELVFWNPEAKEGTIDILNEIEEDSSIFNVLAYESISTNVVLNTANNQPPTYKKDYFTGNHDDYYHGINADGNFDDSYGEDYQESYPEEYPDYDYNTQTYNDIYDSPYNNYFDETITISFCPLLRLDVLANATFNGMIGRSQGRATPKCRQDYSRLYYTILSTKLWSQFSITQGNLDDVEYELDELTKPQEWDEMNDDDKSSLVRRAVDNHQYDDTNYVQCRTYDIYKGDGDSSSLLRELADNKFFCYTNEKCLANQSDVKQNDNSGYGYGYGYDNDDEIPYTDDDIFREKINLNELNSQDIKNSISLDKDYNKNEGCLIDIVNGEIIYDPNISINKEQMIKLCSIMSNVLPSNMRRGGSRKTKKLFCKKPKPKGKTTRKLKKL